MNVNNFFSLFFSCNAYYRERKIIAEFQYYLVCVCVCVCVCIKTIPSRCL